MMSSPNLLELMDRNVNFERAYQTYIDYLNGSANISRVIVELAPLAGYVIKSKLFNCTCIDDVFSAVMEKYFIIVSRKMVPKHSRGSFTSYLWLTAFRAAVDESYSNDSLVFDYDYACAQLPQHKPASHLETERKLYLVSTINNVRIRVLDKIRFVNTYMRICMMIINSALNGETVSNKWLVTRFGVKLEIVEFLRDYSSVILKSCLYDIRGLDRDFFSVGEYSCVV